MAVTLATTPRDRLSLGYNGTGYGVCGYNGQPYDAINNPGGMDGNGVSVNWINMCADMVSCGLMTADDAASASAAASQQEAWACGFVNSNGSVTYRSANSFEVDGAASAVFAIGEFCSCDCREDGIYLAQVSGVSGAIVTVSMAFGVLTQNLVAVHNANSKVVFLSEYAELQASVLSASNSASSADASKTSAEASAEISIGKAAEAAASAASVLPGIDPERLVRAGDLGTAAWIDLVFLHASFTWDAGPVANGGQTSTSVAVPGAEFGDFVQASIYGSLSGLALRGEVTATDTVTVFLTNATGSTVDLANAAYYIRVAKRVPAR